MIGYLAVSLVSAAVSGCGETRTLTDSDAGPGDAAAPGDSTAPMGRFDPIAPDGPMQPGEGDSCEMSVDCGDLQLCVDGACIRHERVPPETLTFGEIRARSIVDVLRDRGVPWPRSLPEGDGRYRWGAWVHPTAGGSGLVVWLDDRSSWECPIAAIGADVRSAWVRGVRCTTATMPAAGGEWHIGAVDAGTDHLLLITLASDGREARRVDISAAIDPQLADAPGALLRAGFATSLMVDGDRVVMSLRTVRPDDVVAVGERWGAQQPVVVAVEADGAVEVLPLTGSNVAFDHTNEFLIAGTSGLEWLAVDTHLRRDGAGPLPLLAYPINGGDRVQLLDDQANYLTPAVFAPGRYSVLSHCRADDTRVVLEPGGVRSVYPWPDTCKASAPPRGALHGGISPIDLGRGAYVQFGVSDVELWRPDRETVGVPVSSTDIADLASQGTFLSRYSRTIEAFGPTGSLYSWAEAALSAGEM